MFGGIIRHVTAVESKTLVFTYIPPCSHGQRQLELQMQIITTILWLYLADKIFCVLVTLCPILLLSPVGTRRAQF